MCSLSLLSLPVLPSSITDTTIYSNQHSKSGTCYISFISTNPKLPVSHVTYIFNNSFSILLNHDLRTHSVTTSDLCSPLLLFSFAVPTTLVSFPIKQLNSADLRHLPYWPQSRKCLFFDFSSGELIFTHQVLSLFQTSLSKINLPKWIKN